MLARFQVSHSPQNVAVKESAARRPGQRLLVVMPHPDDECFASACTIARYAAEGATVSLVTMTRGGAGLWNGRDAGDLRQLTDVRELELRTAAIALGVSFLDVFDYPDGALEKIEEIEATHDRFLADVVRCIRLHRPQVVLTFGPEGVYGHPDHKMVSRLVAEACTVAGESSRFELESTALGIGPWYPSKLYFQSATPATMLALNLPEPARITTRVRTHGFEEARLEAFRAHRTQTQEWEPLRKMVEAMSGEEVFSLVGAADGLLENDLFDGLDPELA
jgi:LmbE family N-acetylglucosaminyl deacetylase